ncbi:MAG: hypothetical protein HKN33_06500 [Pyrinomonadaceae bacterium]|nr:hypothetical protein [Pyrinomonadaceae bacterium]
MKGTILAANMAKKLGQNRKKHSRSYGSSDWARDSKPDRPEDRSGTNFTGRKPLIILVTN